jgi:hypothetical protein
MFVCPERRSGWPRPPLAPPVQTARVPQCMQRPRPAPLPPPPRPGVTRRRRPPARRRRSPAPACLTPSAPGQRYRARFRRPCHVDPFRWRVSDGQRPAWPTAPAPLTAQGRPPRRPGAPTPRPAPAGRSARPRPCASA